MLPDSNDDLSQMLRRLKIAVPALDRDRLLFEAGRRSVKPSWAWPMVTAVSFLLACVTGLIAWQQSQPHHQVRASTSTTSVPQEVIPSTTIRNEPPETLPPFSYLALRHESLIEKHSALPTISGNTKPMPILSAGSYVLPDWQR